MARIDVWVRPGASADRIAWDPWRKCWAVSCQARPIDGAANEAVTGLVAEWLRVPADSVRWLKLSTSRSKTLLVQGLTDEEARERLRTIAGGPNRPGA